MAMSLEEFLSEWENDSPYIEVKTSGSTGEPKRMLVEKRRMLNSARITCDFLGLHKDDTALLCMSLDYIAGKMMVVRSIERGLKLIVQEPNGHPMASSHCVDFAAMVPMQVYNSLQVPEERERLMRIKHLIIGGGAIDDVMAAELKTFPNAVWSTYGMTETLSHIALRRLSGPEASEFYTPFPSVRVSLSDESCLIIDAPEVCPELLITNDIAELKQRGQSPCVCPDFRILGRKDNVICSGGLKLQAEEIERELKPFLRVPYLISKRPDEKFGEVVILLTEGSVDEAREVCLHVLPKYHQPRAYIHLDHIPLTETGKPARKLVAQLMTY